jgi:hypothetical protein
VYCGQKYNVKISNIWPTKTKVRAMEIQKKLGHFSMNGHNSGTIKRNIT